MDDKVPLDTDFANTFTFLISSSILIYVAVNGLEKIKLKIKSLQENEVNYLNEQVELKTSEIKSHEKKLEELRKDIAEEFHAEVGERLFLLKKISSLANQKNNRKDAVLANTENLEETLSQLQGVSKEIHQQSRDFLWSLSKGEHSVASIFAYIRDFAANEFEIKDIDLIVLQQGDFTQFKINTYRTRQIILMVKKAIQNCILESDASCVEFELIIENKNEMIHINLKDNSQPAIETIEKGKLSTSSSDWYSENKIDNQYEIIFEVNDV